MHILWQQFLYTILRHVLEQAKQASDILPIAHHGAHTKFNSPRPGDPYMRR